LAYHLIRLISWCPISLEILTRIHALAQQGQAEVAVEVVRAGFLHSHTIGGAAQNLAQAGVSQPVHFVGGEQRGGRRQSLACIGYLCSSLARALAQEDHPAIAAFALLDRHLAGQKKTLTDRVTGRKLKCR
jgi:hypothetical protein